MVTKDEMKDKILKALYEAGIKDGDLITGLDYLDMVELLMALEEEFDICINEDDFLYVEITNVDDIINYIGGILDVTETS